jgi:hypothetical protein
VEALNDTVVCYYKPHENSEVIRMEFSKSITTDEKKMGMLLTTMKYYVLPNNLIKEPILLYEVDIQAKRQISSATKVYKTRLKWQNYRTDQEEGILGKSECMSNLHTSTSISIFHAILKNCTCVGSIGSEISTDSLTINLYSHGSRMRLRGKLVFFEFIEEGGLNPALDEHPVSTIIKGENCISSISGELDINVATIKPKASYMLLLSNFASKCLPSRTKLYLDTDYCRFCPATSVFDK